jgi:hypothetical protein
MQEGVVTDIFMAEGYVLVTLAHVGQHQMLLFDIGPLMDTSNFPYRMMARVTPSKRSSSAFSAATTELLLLSRIHLKIDSNVSALRSGLAAAECVQEVAFHVPSGRADIRSRTLILTNDTDVINQATRCWEY